MMHMKNNEKNTAITLSLQSWGHFTEESLPEKKVGTTWKFSKLPYFVKVKYCASVFKSLFQMI